MAASDLASWIRGHTGKRVRVPTVRRWFAGESAPRHEHIMAMRDDLHVPIPLLRGSVMGDKPPRTRRIPGSPGTLGGAPAATAPPPSDPRAAVQAPAGPERDQLIAKIRRMLDQGAPAAQVLTVATRASATMLGGGLNTDQQRGWKMLLDMISARAKLEADRKPITQHHQWDEVRDGMLAAVAAVPGAQAALLDYFGVDAPAVAA